MFDLCTAITGNLSDRLGMLLNPSKTQLMFIRTKAREIPQDVEVSINGTTLQQVHSAKYLGVHIDEFYHLMFMLPTSSAKLLVKLVLCHAASEAWILPANDTTT